MRSLGWLLPALWLHVWVPFSASAAGSAASNPALSPPFPRAVNYGWLTDQTPLEEMNRLGGYAGVVVDAISAAANADAFKAGIGTSKALFAAVEWQGKNPEETGNGPTGPALDTIFPGHFLYFQGATIDDAVPADPDYPRVHVNRRVLFTVGDTVVLAPVRLSSGATLFDRNGIEEVVIDSIEADPSGEGGALIVQRAQFGTAARAFVATASRAFPHALAAQQPVWRWNLALNAPADSQGVQASQFVAEELAQWLTVRHPSWDGLILGQARWDLDAGAFGNPGTPNRAADSNADTTADSGYLDGANQFGLSELAMTTRLRTVVGDNKALVVGCEPAGAIAASPWPGPGGAGGAWLERFPDGAPGGDFDSAFARLEFWQDSAPPGIQPVSMVYTQANTTAYGEGGTGPEGNAIFRLGLAAACLADAWHTYTTLPTQSPFTSEVYSWDEYVGGDENRPGWLGYPLEPAQRRPEALGGLSTSGPIDHTGWAIQIRRSGAAAGTPVVEPSPSTAIRVDITGVAAPIPALDDILLLSPDLTIGQPGAQTIRFRAKASFVGAPVPPARDVRVRLARSPSETITAGVVSVGTEWRDYALTLSLSAALTGKVVLEIGGPEGSLWIDQPEIRMGNADRFSRQFQGGIVLLNAGDEPFVFALPGTYRRLNGSVDPATNDGTNGLTQETIPPHDARFLLVDQAEPTPTAVPTPSPTPSPSPTGSPSPSPTIPPTMTPSPTPTEVPTLTPISSVTPTPTLSPSPTASPIPTPPPPGTVIDALLGRGSYTPEQRQAMDRNHDETLDIADLVILLIP